MKRSKKDDPTLSSRRTEQKKGQFFSRGPYCKVRRQAGQEPIPVHATVEQIQRTFPVRATSPPISLETRADAPIPRATPTGQRSSSEASHKASGWVAWAYICFRMALVTQHVLTPVGGRLAHFVENWQEISSDPWVLGTVTGSRIDFHATPIQYNHRRSWWWTLPREISSRERSENYQPSSEGFSGSLFLVPKANSSWRSVLNLKLLNRFVPSQHFKMESARTVKNRETI